MSLFSRLSRKLKPNETPKVLAVVAQGKTDEELAGAFGGLEEAQELFLSGELERALEMVERLKTLGKSIEVLELEGEIRGAIVAWKRSPEEEAEIWFDRGNQFYYAGDYENAIAFYDKVIEFKHDYHEVWSNRGVSLYNLGRYEESIASFDNVIEFKHNYHEGWSNRGISLYDLGRYEESIDSYDKAIEFKHNYHEGWSNRGVSLNNLGRYEEAIASFDKAIEFKHDYHEAWYNRGSSLNNLGRYEEAIASYDKAIEFEHDGHEVWYNRGNSLNNLGRHEEAIASFDKTIEFKHDDHKAWYNRGNSLGNLGRHEEAIASFDKTIEFKHDDHKAWNSRGSSLGNLGRDEEAIASFDKAIEFKRDSHEVWYNRGITAYSARGKTQPNPFTLQHPALNNRGYQGQLASLTIGLTYCPVPIAQGFLHRAIGDAHSNQARTDVNPGPYWRKALTAYSASLKSLPSTDYPEEHLETLQSAIPALIALQEIPTARQYQTHGIQLFNQLRAKTQNKQTFDHKFAKFSRTEIDLLIGENNPIQALEQAEFYKNRALTWILDAWQETTLSPSHEEMRSCLTTTTTAILYWHLSEYALTTFILTPSNPNPIILPIDRHQKAIHLTNLLTDYKRDYTSYRNLPKDTAPEQRQQHPWRLQLPQWLDRLTEILDINAIATHLNDIQNLILLPHRDLHLLPIHTLLPTHHCTYLPSLQTALNQPKNLPTPSGLLAIDDHTDSLEYSRIESAIVRKLTHCETHLTPDQASHTNAIAALTQPHSLLHFSGHGAYDIIRPENSAIALAEQNLTAKTIAALDLSTYQLITLAACETGLTGKDTTTEYIGLTSAFLKANAQTILSTLWQVDELSSTWLIVRFYQAYLQGKSPARALAIAQTWLKTLTYRDLTTWLTQLLQTHPNLIEYRDNIEAHLANIREDSSKMDSSTPPYGHPYYWAGYILTGNPSL